ncbi:MAG: SGNH/GDSL hydrolase family protein [Planctomycetota bacterium]
MLLAKSRRESPPIPAPTRLTWRKKLLFSLVVFLLGLGVVEVVIRAVVGQPLPERLPMTIVRAHRTRGWEMVPNADHYTYHHLVKVNRLGLRGPELPARKAPGERRVLVLGDSMVYGQGVADDETVPAQLERALGRPGTTVINGGLRAYSTAQELALLKELGGKIRPDLVVLCWFWNDLDADPVEVQYRGLAGLGEVLFDTRAPVDGMLRFRWRVRRVVRKSALVMLAYDLLSPDGDKWPSREAQVAGRGKLDAHLAEFKRWCAEHGARLVFVVIPNPNSLRGHPSEKLEEEAAALARWHELPVVETLPALRALADRAGSILIPFDGHYNPAANGVIADEIAREARLQLR